MKGFSLAAALVFAAAVSMGCAGAKVTGTSTDRNLARPPVVIVYNFAVGADDVVNDTIGSAFESEGKELTDEEKLGYETSNVLAQHIVEKLNKKGIAAERATSGRPPLHAFVLKGQFVTIDKGSRLKRMVIGFGAGSSELRVRAQVYQVTSWGMSRIGEAEAEASGSKMPGMAVPVAGGAAMGTAATSAAISAGMNIVKETRGAMSPDAAHIAGKIADRAENFYKGRGWL